MWDVLFSFVIFLNIAMVVSYGKTLLAETLLLVFHMICNDDFNWGHICKSHRCS